MKHLKNHKNKFLIVSISALLVFVFSACNSEKEQGIVERITRLDKKGELIIQLAELQIDSTHLDDYLALLKEGIQTSVDKEDGVLSLYAMADKNNPTKITVVEVYANQKAYSSHIASAHFQKYKIATLDMVDSLKLTRTTPVVFAAKPN